MEMVFERGIYSLFGVHQNFCGLLRKMRILKCLVALRSRLTTVNEDEIFRSPSNCKDANEPSSIDDQSQCSTNIRFFFFIYIIANGHHHPSYWSFIYCGTARNSRSSIERQFRLHIPKPKDQVWAFAFNMVRIPRGMAHQ